MRNVKKKRNKMDTVMESVTTNQISVKASVVKSKEKISVPSFDFEKLIIEHQRKFPRTAAGVENPKDVEALLNPFKKFYRLPVALFKVKLNTILAMRWREFTKLWVYVVILMIPNIILAHTALTTPKVADVLFTVSTPIIIAVIMSLFYLKYTHDGFLGLIMEKRIEWLEKPVRDYYNKFYDRKLPTNPLLIITSILTGLGMSIPLVNYSFSQGIGVAKFFGIVACFFNPILLYIFILATYYMILNTRIYSKVLKTIKQKISVYQEEYGTLLNKENYEIIWALGNTPGRSIRQLENIPISGILSAVIITIAMVMGWLNQLIYGIKGWMPEVGFKFLFIQPENAWSVLVVLIGVLIAIILVLIIVFPIYLFGNKMKKFKIKALMELDNYIFASVMEFDKRYAEVAKVETSTMYQLRGYIAGMRTVPISTGKIIKSLTAVVIWVLNMQRIFTTVAGGGT